MNRDLSPFYEVRKEICLTEAFFQMLKQLPAFHMPAIEEAKRSQNLGLPWPCCFSKQESKNHLAPKPMGKVMRYSPVRWGAISAFRYEGMLEIDCGGASR